MYNVEVIVLVTEKLTRSVRPISTNTRAPQVDAETTRAFVEFY